MALDLPEEVSLADARLLYTVQREPSNFSGLILGEHDKLTKRYMKPDGRKLVSEDLDQVDYAEKMEATVAAHLTANRRCRASLCFTDS